MREFGEELTIELRLEEAEIVVFEFLPHSCLFYKIAFCWQEFVGVDRSPY